MRKCRDLKKGYSATLSDWNVHGQSTYLFQTDPNFRSPYVGPHSLIPGQSRETWDATAYLGLKVAPGIEVWFNPEIDQGFGLSDTFGVAGFTSGEAYKLGAAEPYARIPRLFVRDTIPLGGTVQSVSAAPNQFATEQTADRLVFTAGKFSVTDVFDTNRYAHDPRNDFMNWALVDTGTFDYAADAWGFTVGAVLEWYFSDWTMRTGLVDLSDDPGGIGLDPNFSQYQALLEIEHRYALWSAPGKWAVTGFLSRGRMGKFADAIALAQATGEPADIAAVRDYRSRPGVSINVEQQISSDLGFFARAGIANGQIEPFAFTDIDRTMAAGFVMSGAAWGRKRDAFAVSAVVNGITGLHETFLDYGGLGILVGDGQLPHPGLEEILETYYAFPIGNIQATLDYQFVNNPAYNRDRGPVSVLGGRLHSQF